MPVKPLVCDCCKQEIDDSFTLSQHKSSPLHKLNFLLWAYNKKEKSLIKDKDGVRLQIALNNKDEPGLVMIYDNNTGKYSIEVDPTTFNARHNTLEFRCTLHNDRRENDMFITAANILDASTVACIYDDKEDWMKTGKFIKIKPKERYDRICIKFHIDSLIVGSFRIPLAFNLQTEKGDICVTLCRTILITIIDWEEDKSILGKHRSPFTEQHWDGNVQIIRPRRSAKILKKYLIPPLHAKFFKRGLKEWNNITREENEILGSIKSNMEPGYLTPKNYKDYLHNCLWLEEIVTTLMLHRYNMESVPIELRGNYLHLEVPGLAEKRPSLIKGDLIRLRFHEDVIGYEGFIKKVEDQSIIIEHVNTEFLGFLAYNPGAEIDVAFQLGRLPLERSHQGIDNVCSRGILKALFPDELTFGSYKKIYNLSDADFINTDIINNHEQKTAVEKILNRSSLEAPYIVYGPPGTGKTVTIVEAIMQIMKKTDRKILVCAPANAACDMLTLKLINAKCGIDELKRYHSETRDISTIPSEIWKYSNITNQGLIKAPTAKELNNYRIVITTLILIGKFSNGYEPDCLFIDEAAQALESDACVALGVIKKEGQIVLAGDPKQLGPIVQSKIAEGYGLNKSLLERLMDLETYRNMENSRFITMLKKNFRSHPTILEIPNKRFYDNNLNPVSNQSDPVSRVDVFGCITKFNVDLEKCKKSLVSGKPIEFCAVSAKERREGQSPSYFNPAEANMVLNYVKTLIDLKLKQKVKQTDIGIITPYIRQVYKIKTLLRNNKLKDVEVGSVEAFQGREKRIIIISTVRAQHDLLKHDKNYLLGFVRQEKRFNVALTRAATKLIVIGCPTVLATDDKWKDFMIRCRELNSYHGAPFAIRTEDKMAEIIEKLSAFPTFSKVNT